MKTNTVSENTSAGAPVLSPTEAAQVRRSFRIDAALKDGTALRLIGGWQDIAGFYATPAGKVYSIARLAAYGGDRFIPCGHTDDLPGMFRNLRGGIFAEGVK